MKVGITGHQYLGAQETVAWVTTQIEKALTQLPVEHGFTSLARGADQIFAHLMIKLKRPYTAIIPCRNYEHTFQTPEHLEQYRILLLEASSRLTLDFERPEEIAFFAAGKSVVEHSDFMIAVWNGLPAKGLGGTADVVQYACDHKKHVVHINPISLTIAEF